MKKTIVKYYCDVCQKEVDKETDLSFSVIPIKYLRGFSQSAIMQDFQICKDCKEKLLKVIEEHFADISLIENVGVEIHSMK